MRYDAWTVQLRQFMEVYLEVWCVLWKIHGIITATAYSSVHEYLLSACCISGSVLAVKDNAVKSPDLSELPIYFLVLW